MDSDNIEYKGVEKKTDIKSAAIISYGVLAFNVCAGLFYTPWMVSKLGKNDYGLYILVTTFIAYFIVDYGIWQSINLLISKYRATNDILKINQTTSVAINIYLILDFVLCLILLGIYFQIDTIFSNLSIVEIVKFKKIFFISSIFAVINFPLNFVKGLMYGYEYLVQYNYFEVSSKVLIILMTVTVLVMNGDLYWFVFVYAFVPFLKNVFILFFLIKQGVRIKYRFWNKKIALTILGASSWLFLYVIGELLINNISPTIISLKSTIDQITIFSIGMTIYGYVYQICNAVSGFFLPKLTKMKLELGIEEIESYAVKVGRIQLLISGFVIFGVIVSGEFFIKAWMGNMFEKSYYVALFLVTPGLIIFSQQVEQSYLFISGLIKYRTILMCFTAISSLIFSITLTPKYGAVGPAIAISISSFLFMAIGMNVVYHKILKLNQIKFYEFWYKFLAVFIMIAIIVMTIAEYSSLHNNWTKFFVIGTLYSVLYFFVTYLLLLNKSEKELLKKLVLKFK